MLLLFQVKCPYNNNKEKLPQFEAENALFGFFIACNILTLNLSLALLVSKTIDFMIIDHARGLHQSIANC